VNTAIAGPACLCLLLQTAAGTRTCTRSARVSSAILGLRRAAIALSYRLHVAAYPPGRVHRAVPSNQTDKLPSGSQWLHEIKHDGFRIIARKNGSRVKLYSRPGNDFTHRFPLIVEALARLPSRSCIIDGEAVACDDNIYPSFT